MTKPRILVVDDETNVVRLMQVNLERQGYIVQTAYNGWQAWKILQDEEPFDLIITDVMMPEMDGLALERRIRENVSLKTLPVLFLTSRTAEADSIRQSIDVYSNDTYTFVVKPFTVQTLWDTVKKLLSQHKEGSDK